MSDGPEWFKNVEKLIQQSDNAVQMGDYTEAMDKLQEAHDIFLSVKATLDPGYAQQLQEYISDKISKCENQMISADSHLLDGLDNDGAPV